MSTTQQRQQTAAAACSNSLLASLERPSFHMRTGRRRYPRKQAVCYSSSPKNTVFDLLQTSNDTLTANNYCFKFRQDDADETHTKRCFSRGNIQLQHREPMSPSGALLLTRIRCNHRASLIQSQFATRAPDCCIRHSP